MRIERHSDEPAWEGVDLRVAGMPEVPLLGLYRHRAAVRPLALHTHRGHLEICYLAAGRQVYHVGGRDYVLAAGDLFVTAPDAPHGSGTYPEEKGVLHWVQVRLTRPKGFLGLPGAEGPALVAALRALRGPHGVANDEVRRLFPLLQEWVRQPDGPMRRARVRAGLVALLMAVVESLAVPAARRRDRGINRVLALIEAEPGGDLSVPRLAAVAKLSVPWFQARFRREVGMPPAEYVLRHRIARAAAWLRTTERSITDIAFDLGFSSTQYFATVFRRYQGRSPTAERRLRPSDKTG